jgi:hypothetical protein
MKRGAASKVAPLDFCVIQRKKNGTVSMTVPFF